ncbi:MAG: DUF4388 domain-containing protein [Vicinamibacteria bacterium]
MSLAGRLETLDLAGILQTLAVGSATGRLTLTRLDSHAVLVLRRGRVEYVAGGASSEPLASRLLRSGLVGEADLLEALRRQHDGDSPRRLADVVVGMGLLAAGTVQSVVRSHIQDLVTELLTWKTGFFRFEPAASPDAPTPEVDLGDFVLPGGLSAQELVMRAATAIDTGTAPPMPRPPGLLRAAGREDPDATLDPRSSKPARALTGSFPVDYTGEAVLSLLRFVSQVLSRAIVFAIDGPFARGVGEYGIVAPPGAAEHETAVPLREPSVLRLAVERRRTYVGPLEPLPANVALAERLGGGPVGVAVAIPLLVRGEVRYVLYGDNAADSRPVGPLDALESAAARAARVIEKTLDAREPKAPA